MRVIVNAGPGEVQHYPGLSLRQFGITPAGAAIFRCIWSQSRLHLCGGKWPDGKIEYRWAPRYGPRREAWVLEQWMDAEAYAGTPEAYTATNFDPESGLFVTGPYPRNGEFEESFLFDGPCSPWLIARKCQAIIAGWSKSLADIKLAITENLAHAEMRRIARAIDIWQDAQGAFGNRASNLNPAKLTAEKMRLTPLPADHALPAGNGKAFTVPESAIN